MVNARRGNFGRSVPAIEWQASMVARFRDLPQWQPEFAAAGYQRKLFFRIDSVFCRNADLTAISWRGGCWGAGWS